MSPRRLLILFAHPAFQKSRINRELFGAAESLPEVTTNDLYELYPHFHIDVAREQQLLLDHDVIVWQHPFYWYSSPAILKQWEDLVLEFGFAYGKNGTKLRDKLVFSAISMGGPFSAYTREGQNCFTIREFLVPFEQTARLCGMIYLPPFVVPGALWMNEEAEIQRYSAAYRRLLEALRDYEIPVDKLLTFTTLNDAIVLLKTS
jgi:glutathione-regulated potassium-efflux system ancillary protein KefG